MKAQLLLACLSMGFAVAIPSPKVSDSDQDGGQLVPVHHGLATVYNQFGVAGSCGEKHSELDLIVALGNFWMQGKPHASWCGRKIKVTNTGSHDGVGGKGKSVVVTVKDTCPSCTQNHIDLSFGAWNRLTNNAAPGTVNIDWHFCGANGVC